MHFDSSKCDRAAVSGNDPDRSAEKAEGGSNDGNPFKRQLIDHAVGRADVLKTNRAQYDSSLRAIRQGQRSLESTSSAEISSTLLPKTPPTSPGFNYDATHGEDSRLIAYVGNWQTCPTDAQVDAYSHIVIAFAVSYTWSWSKNNCDATCSIAAPPTCNNQVRTDLIDQWRAKGKKVILSFGGAGMGGSWSGDQNNCW